MLRAAWFALARTSSVWASALRREKAVEDAAHTLRVELDQVGTKIGAATPRTSQHCAQADQSSDCSNARSAGSWSVKSCCCRFKVFALECEGQHYCRCGYPIKSYAFYDISPAMQALLPIIVVLAAIGLLYALTAPVMNWDKAPVCDDTIVACLEGG
jgi:hypothetical protein